MLSGRTLIGSSFVLINIIACFIMIQTGELIGDVKGVFINDYGVLGISAILVCISYVVVLFFLFNYLVRIKFPKVKFKYEHLAQKRIGILFFVLQILFVFFNLFNGVNIAGSGNSSTSSIFSIFWVFFPVDLFLVIYYAFFRRSGLFKVNISVAIFSSIVRGRADIFVLILFFEICRKIRDKSLSIKKLAFLSLAILCFYPAITALKFAFRLYLGDGGEGQSLDFIFFELINRNQGDGYLYILYSGFEHIVGRLQTVSLVSEIARFSNELLEVYSQGGFYPFWLEGLHGIIIDQVLGNPRNVPLGTAFTSVGDFNWEFDVGDWNTNPGLVGWIVLNPLWTGSYVIYILLLCFLSVFFSKLIGESDMRNDMIWYSWAFYLMPAWIGIFVLFIYTLFLFFMIKSFFSYLPPIKILGRTI
ncbi:hypothetical protein CWN94_21305 [Vibrio splendidus]|uniref:oligosaccharide repeat unit polymerase n=1 Tax=Vibrio splendidus TaxID=29497 RepID=UPI000D3CC65C|nr:oligosaccharide repeat unit polymerase [Vibrio splendidus]PTO51482.1 hypothetical protein CWN94_21305 [Vibrio splendidus]